MSNFYLFFLFLILSLIVFNILLSGTRLSLKKSLAYLIYLGVILIAFHFIFFYLINLPNMFILTFLLYVFSIAVLTDTFAYVAGSLFGKHKLAPYISPKKTFEGAVGAIILTSIVAAIVFYSFSFKLSFGYFMLIIVFGTVIAQIGDLLESWTKRVADVKDSSSLIPGHGGLLDRLDSFIFLIFVVQLLLWY
jgi:phosphatidate cytidylyltransferase